MTAKLRVTVTLDPDLVEAGQAAVASGAADSLSAWVSTALTEQLRREQQLRHLATAIADYESEHGAITEEEVLAVRDADRRSAVRPTGGRKRKSA